MPRGVELPQCLRVGLASAFLALAALGSGRAAEVASPNGKVTATFSVTAGGRLFYGVEYQGKPILADSRLGLTLEGAPALDRGFRITKVARTSNDKTWRPVYGQWSEIRDHYNQLTVDLEDDSRPPRRLRLEFRA
mgnify:CR=1 FL=1